MAKAKVTKNGNVQLTITKAEAKNLLTIVRESTLKDKSIRSRVEEALDTMFDIFWVIDDIIDLDVPTSEHTSK